jgi:REP element-mobilizing transposase RayT
VRAQRRGEQLQDRHEPTPAKGVPALRAKYREPVLWSRSYFVASVGGAPLTVIKQYIEQQARPL